MQPTTRLHFGTRLPVSHPGGLHGVIRGLTGGQRDIGLDPLIVDEVHGAKQFNGLLVPSGSRYGGDESTIFPEPLMEFHFAQTVRDGLRSVVGSKANRMFHFHGPWGAEGRVQGNGRLRSFVKTAVERRAYGQFAAFTADSVAFQNVLTNDFGIPKANTRVIYPGINTNEFTPQSRVDSRRDLGLPVGEKLFVAVRRLEPRMGLDLAIQAIAQSPDTFLAIAGQGSQRGPLENLASELGVSDRVRFLGRLPQEQLATFYSAGDAALVPTRALEGFGLVVLEAFACGTPVIASDMGGLPEAMGPYARDWTFNAGAVAQLTELMGRVLHAPPTRDELRDHALTQSWSEVAKRVEEYAIEAL